MNSEMRTIKTELDIKQKKDEEDKFQMGAKMKMIRTFWIFGLFFTAYQVFESVSRFSDYKSAISQKDMMDSTPLPFPVIILCPDSIHSMAKVEFLLYLTISLNQLTCDHVIVY